MVLLRNAVECFAKIAMTALRSGRATMFLLPDHDRLRRIIPGARGCAESLIRNWAQPFNANKIPIEAPSTEQILPPANDRMAERAMDGISFDKPPPNQQEIRAARARADEAAA
jgi:hypothetical protein